MAVEYSPKSKNRSEKNGIEGTGWRMNGILIVYKPTKIYFTPLGTCDPKRRSELSRAYLEVMEGI